MKSILLFLIFLNSSCTFAAISLIELKKKTLRTIRGKKRATRAAPVAPVMVASKEEDVPPPIRAARRTVSDPYLYSSVPASNDAKSDQMEFEFVHDLEQKDNKTSLHTLISFFKVSLAQAKDRELDQQLAIVDLQMAVVDKQKMIVEQQRIIADLNARLAAKDASLEKAVAQNMELIKRLAHWDDKQEQG